MSKTSKYNFFIFFSALARNVIEVFSSIMLYKVGFSIREIYFFFCIYYFFGLIINFLSIYIGNKINYNIILIFSTLIYAYSFYYLSNINNNICSLIIFGILLSISSFSYHIIRHYYALISLGQNKIKKIGNILIFNYAALIISSYVGSYISNKIVLIIIVILSSIISIIPLFNLKYEKNKKIKYEINKINKSKLLFFIFEQTKVIFILLEPLYIYLSIGENIKYIGILNIIINIISILFLLFFVKKMKANYFIYLNIIFSIILILKINIFNYIYLFIITIFQVFGLKIYELYSDSNLYDIEDIEPNGYIIVAETIFCSIKLIIFLFFYIFNFNLKTLMYICILGIFGSSFIYNVKLLKK